MRAAIPSSSAISYGVRFSIQFLGRIAAESERVGLGLFAGLFADAVKVCGDAVLGCVHQEVGEFVEHHEELMLAVKLAVDGDEMPALHAVVKSLGSQRHLGHGHAKPLAKSVKVTLGEGAFVPRKSETSCFFGEELHNLGAANLYDR